MFADAAQDVDVHVFSGTARTQAAEQFLSVLAQVQTVVPQLQVTMCPYSDRETVVERAPALALFGADGSDRRVRFYGWPTGYEFSAFLGAAADAARTDSVLHADTLTALAGLKHDVQIKVFSTPT